MNEISDSKEFLFVIEPMSDEEAAIKYDETFDDFEDAIVNLSKGSNNDYKDTKGLSFSCGTRDKSSNETGVFGAALSGTDRYIYMCQTRYEGQGRQPIITFTRTNSGSFINGAYIEADLMFGENTSTIELYVQDSSNKTVELSAPEGYAGKWLHYVLAKSGSGTAIMIYDEDGKPVSYAVDKDGLKNVARFTTADVIYPRISINNIKISDIAYTMPEADIVAAAKANLDITDITVKDDKYQAATDFDLPEAPTGTTVSWKVMQKAKGASEWEDSSFIAISGTSAVIKPTKDIDGYDVKLVAEISSGEASDTKDFAVELPNPMDEISGILNDKFGVVNTTDKDAQDKDITFDLKGKELLKRDLILPLSVKAYKNASISWSSSDEEHISIDEEGKATLMTSDFGSHEVTLTAVVKYKKNDIEYSSEPQNFKVKMGFESEDATSDDDTMGKYRVRYDAAYRANFAIPAYASSENITLPKDGMFGSEFTWTSSAPTVISNSGKVTKPSTTKTVTLTAAIISGSASDTASFSVTVSGSSGGGGGGGGGGSRTPSTTGTINNGTSSGVPATSTAIASVPVEDHSASLNVAKLQEEALAANDKFKDIAQAAWARDAINSLAAKGVINGKSDTEFAPNDTVTRAEFAKMLMGAFGLASEAYTTSSFYDVPAGEWYFQFVEAAYNLGIIQGTASGIFEPNALITRQDMAVMVARAAVIAGKDLTATRDMLGFTDSGRIASYALEAVEQLVKAGAMSGKSDTEFAPLENATRAQAAQILFNLVG